MGAIRNSPQPGWARAVPRRGALPRRLLPRNARKRIPPHFHLRPGSRPAREGQAEVKTFLNSLRATLSAAPQRGASQTAPVQLDISAYETIYAVGDVHGCLELVRDLELKIHEAAEADDSGSDQIALLRLCGAFGEMPPDSNSTFKDHAQGSIQTNFVAECMQSQRRTIRICATRGRVF